MQFNWFLSGTGKSPVKGDRVVVDWEGYTIGYYGRPFQTRNKVETDITGLLECLQITTMRQLDIFTSEKSIGNV